MEEELSFVPLQEKDPAVSEQMVFFPMVTVGEKWVTPAGKLIAPQRVRHIADVENLLILQHGLPGDQWRIAAEEKARKLAAQTQDVSTLLLVPGGVRPDRYNLDVSSEGDPSEMQQCLASRPFFFLQPFSFQRYVRTLAAAMDGVRQHAAEDATIHIAGHSYGALAALYALRRSEHRRKKPPASTNFLAPFVLASLDTGEHRFALNVINTDVRNRTPGAVKIRRMRPAKVDQRLALGSVLSDLRHFYNLTRPDRDSLEYHRTVFNQRFFQALSGTAVDEGCAVRIFRGSEDPYINVGHSGAIVEITGRQRLKIEKVLRGDGHDLASLDFRELVAG